MVFERPAPPSPNQDLRGIVAEYMSTLAVPAGLLNVRAEDVQVVRQRTTANRPQAISEGPATAAVASCLAISGKVPPGGRQALGLYLAYQPSPEKPWGISVQQSLSLTLTRIKPFEMFCVVNPLIGLSLGVYVFEGPVGTLRAELPDGTLLEEDKISQQGLLIHLPVHSSRGWSKEESPVFRILDTAGKDIMPPARVPLQPRIPPSDQSIR